MSQVKRFIFEQSKAGVSNSSVFMEIPSYEVIDEIFIRPVDSSGNDSSVTNAEASIGNISLQIDGNDVVNCSYTQLRQLYSMLGTNVYQSTTSGAVIGLNIARLLLDIQEVRDKVGFGTANVANIQVRIECKTLTSGANQVANFEAYTVRRQISRNLDTFFRAINYEQTISGAGTLAISTLPKNTNDIYYLLSLGTGTGGVVSWNRFKVNGRNITDMIPGTLNDARMAEVQYTQPTGTSVIPLMDGSLRSGVPVLNVTDIQAEFNFTTAPSEKALPLLAVTLHNPTTEILNAIAA